jgi:mannose-6-phosphate isomerase-like protein (cupin superfamily)
MAPATEDPMAKTKAKTQAKPARRQASSKRRALPKARPKTRSKARPKQRFTVSHHRDEDFDAGLRRYAHYRDLGINKATNGLVQAHVIRFVPPCRPDEVSKRHYHDVDFQMVYVLKGWIKTELDGQGVHVMKAGSCWIQPPRIEHVVHDYSDDCEVLEIVLPADFKTVELE